MPGKLLRWWASVPDVRAEILELNGSSSLSLHCTHKEHPTHRHAASGGRARTTWDLCQREHVGKAGSLVGSWPSSSVWSAVPWVHRGKWSGEYCRRPAESGDDARREPWSSVRRSVF